MCSIFNFNGFNKLVPHTTLNQILWREALPMGNKINCDAHYSFLPFLKWRLSSLMGYPSTLSSWHISETIPPLVIKTLWIHMVSERQFVFLSMLCCRSLDNTECFIISCLHSVRPIQYENHSCKLWLQHCTTVSRTGGFMASADFLALMSAPCHCSGLPLKNRKGLAWDMDKDDPPQPLVCA